MIVTDIEKAEGGFQEKSSCSLSWFERMSSLSSYIISVSSQSMAFRWKCTHLDRAAVNEDCS